MRNAALVDSGPLLALFDRDDSHHARVVDFMRANPSLRLITTWPVLNETAALLAARVGKQAEIDFLEWVVAGAVSVADLGNAELIGMVELIRKYRDLPFDFADASIAELAAGMGIDQVLSIDSDFDVYRSAQGKPLRNLLGPGSRKRRPVRPKGRR